MSDLSRILKSGESETLELKGPRTALESLAKTVCGFLNQQGGVILWGVSADRSAVGIRDAQLRVRELNDFLVQNISPRPLFSVSSHLYQGKDLIVVDVPQGADKPYSFQRDIWVRVGGGTFKATADVASTIVESTAAQLERWENEPMPGFSVTDCDSEELVTTKRELIESERFGVEVPQDDEELLHRLQLTRNGQLTYGAVVLFAKNPVVWLPNVVLRMITYASDKMGQIANDTTLKGPAIWLLKEVISLLQQRTGYTSRFETQQAQRRDKPAYALFALREGLVNAFVHRDFALSSSPVVVEIFPDQLTIQNPGELPAGWTVDDLKKSHHSHPHNPDIAKVFYLRGLMEQLGMGTQKLIIACRDLGAKPPVWRTERGTVSLTLFRAPEPEVSVRLSERQSNFLKLIKPSALFKVSDFVSACAVSERQARRDLAELESLGLIEKQGKGPATAYLRTHKSES